MPSCFDGSQPFGSAWGQHIYWRQQVNGPTIDGTEARNDYVVVVLDRSMGDLTGWMGSRTYDDGWDGGNYWSHIGYPGDLATGIRPSFQGSFSLNGEPTIGGMPADRGFRDRAGIPADGGQRNCAVSAS